MQRIKFSLIIPTRERHTTLFYSIQSALNLTEQDYEVIICDNFSSEETYHIVQQFEDSRLIYTRSDQRLSMIDNFERGLALAQGDYITIIGDDDCIIPSVFPIVSQQAIQTQAPVCWFRYPYYWPNSVVCANHLMYVSGVLDKSILYELDSRKTLETCFENFINYQYLPSVYNSWIPRKIIEEIKSYNLKTFGSHRFYPPKCESPDVFSSLQILQFSQNFIYSALPFSLSGISGRSNGTVDPQSNSFPEETKKFIAESGRNSFNELVHPELTQIFNLDSNSSISTLQQLGIATDYFNFLDQYFSHNSAPKIKITKNKLITSLVVKLISNSVITINQANQILIKATGSANPELANLPNLADIGFYFYTKVPTPQPIWIKTDDLGIHNSYEAACLYDRLLQNHQTNPETPTPTPSFTLHTPIAFFIFNRPTTTQQIFQAIRQAKPPKLLIVADGPRPDRLTDPENCALARSFLDQIVCDCVFLTIFCVSYLGCR